MRISDWSSDVCSSDLVAWLQRAVGDRTPRFVDVGEMAVITGSRIYSGGYFDPRSAGIHPLNYCRGFAAALSARGVEIYRRTPASAITLLEGNDGVREIGRAHV